MVMLQAAMVVAVIVVMVMVVGVIVIVIVTVAGFEKFRFDLEDAIEIERAALQHIGQRDLAALGTMQLGIGVDAANPGLDFGQFSLGDEVGLVEHDDVG